MRLIAHDIRSLHNVGAIFRSADAFGVEKIYLTGYTPTPPRKEIAKVALGGEDRVAWEHAPDPLPLVEALKQGGWTVVALENGVRAEPIASVAASVDAGKTVLVLGNEVEGIPAALLAACDRIAEIPMPGRKRSLNVSVATGVALFAFGAKNGYPTAQ